MRRFIASLLLLILAGCASMPFEKAEHVSLETSDPRIVVDRFKDRVADSFQLLNSIVFEYNWFTLSGIGYIDIQGKDGFYKVACLNQMGVKLFEFSGNRDGIISRFAIEPLARKGDITALVAEDIKRIYFDRVPSPEARLIVRKHELIFRQRQGEGTLEYVFAGTGGHLVSKTYLEENRALWRVSYYEYLEKSGKIHPGGIIFRDYRYGYRLIVKQKEIRD